MPEETEVLYSVQQAIKELTKLDKQVGKSGKKAKDSFKKSDKAILSFDNNLTRATRNFIRGFSPAIGAAIRPTDNFLSGVIRLTTELGPLAPAVLSVGAAVGVAAAAFIDFNEVARNSTIEIQGVIKALRDTLTTTDLLSNIIDQKELRKFKDRTRELTKIQAELNIEQASATQDKLALQNRLNNNLATLKKIEANEQQSAKSIQRIRDQAFVGSGATGAILNAQITEVLDQAAKSRQSGDLERATRLLQGARQLAADAQTDKPEFFLERIRQQEREITKAPETQKVGDSALRDRLTAENELLQEQIVLATRRSQVITPKLKAIRGEKRQIEVARQELVEVKKIEELERSRAVAVKAVNTALNKQKTIYEDIGTAARAILSIASPFGGIGGDAFIDQVRGIKRIKDDLRSARNSLRADTEGGDIAAGEQLTRVNQFLEIAARLEAEGILSGALKKDLAQSRLVRTELEKILLIRGQLTEQGASSPIPTPASQLRTEAIEQATEAATLPGDRRPTVIIDVAVTGGPIDGETIKKFIPVIRREARKAVSESIA